MAIHARRIRRSKISACVARTVPKKHTGGNRATTRPGHVMLRR
ncbi:hypothetical protein GDI1783 [Gluconacetobacter diazotrophicus PA1 5]|uniref:Uncharacterized protein n=1 Tax=Gluconacetobacter diazotrophicus (strain ATCC 49037 / DSM 5601 / CCUG 37298 / CIP 103539 / LMG 7603 / PAl5) TaxID=272568 RepID=A9HI61_GLUDA|nr:hypothetical protein GDI1783 [Gluconacetobacter diazotrophicus PA1 5]